MTAYTTTDSDDYAETSDVVTTDEARDRLEDTMFSALETARDTLIEAPTSIGKTHTVATTRWLEHPEITGGGLVIHLHQTKKARNQAVEKSKEADGVTYHLLEGREDACPTARGEYDDTYSSPDGRPPSEWFEWMCDVRKHPFGQAHLEFENYVDAPCTHDGPCQAFQQWWRDLRDDGEPTVDVVHATAQFAHVADLIDGANVIVDERPEYKLTYNDRERTQLTDAVTNLLAYRSDGEYAKPHLQTVVLGDGSEWEADLRELLRDGVPEDWYFGREETHRLAPEIGRAMLNAEEVFPDRYVGRADGVDVVMDGQARIRHVQHTPDFSDARCVIGLDAHPSVHRWQMNTVDDLVTERVLTAEERRAWRRHERGLRVVQLGDATRQYTRGFEGAGEERAGAIIRYLRREHGEAFRSCITPQDCVDEVERLMLDAGIEEPETMYYGVQKSRNDFENELIGALIGCIDPGDDPILDLLALRGLTAEPEMVVTEEGEETRKPDRTFVGPDAEVAVEVLESVRENNIAQAVGRYARDPDSDDSGATVYVWSDACPDSLTDEVVDVTYRSVSPVKKEIAQALQEDSPMTALEIADEIGRDKDYINTCLDEIHEQGVVEKDEGAGYQGATEWAWTGGELQSTVILQ